MVPQVSADGELGLRDYLPVLRRRKWSVAIVTFLVVTPVLVISFLQTPVYEAQVKVMLQPQSGEAVFNPNTGQWIDRQRAVQTEIEVLESEPVRAAVRERVGGNPSVSVEAVDQADIIEIRARSPEPQRAAATANAYAEEYIELRRAEAAETLLGSARQIQAKVRELQAQADDLDRRIAANDSPGGPDLRPQRDSLNTQIALFRERLDQLQVEAAVATGGAQIVNRAAIPTSPVEPKPLRNGALALGGGLMLAVGLAFVRDQLDDKITNKDDLDRLALGLPVLALIPEDSGAQSGESAFVVSLREPSSPTAEAYRTLRTALQFISLDRAMRTVQVTSASAGDGKTTTVANLAVAIARAGQRVVAVSADLRRPRLAQSFGFPDDVGLTSVVIGKATTAEAVQRFRGDERLRVLPSGPLPPNPSELLSSPRTVQALTTLQTGADIVLIDSPPLLPVADALVLSGLVDATLLVAAAGRTTRRELRRALELLKTVDAPLVGIVLTRLTGDATYGYGYGYGPARGRRLTATSLAATASPNGTPATRKRAHPREKEPGEPSQA